VVANDVALHAAVPPERRRGIAGAVLIHKLAGAAAKLGSMGVALDACTVPAAGRPGFGLGRAEIELGLGIHGERGESGRRWRRLRRWSSECWASSWRIGVSNLGIGRLVGQRAG
jgi:dihydroxyacetone kinase